jgi:ATP-dependent helicase/nuclease subunit A
MESSVSSGSSERLKKYFDPERGEMKDVLIRAGAGAGKTTELVRRVISLALTQREKNREWPRLVVTTFTRKATQELRERLLQAGLQIGDENLLQYLQNSQSLHISTIHGILSVYLKRYGREIDLPPDFQIIDSVQMTRMSRRALRSLLKESREFAEDFQALSEETELKVLEQAAREWNALLLQEASVRRMTHADLTGEWERESVRLLAQARETVAELQAIGPSGAWDKWLTILTTFANSKDDLRRRIAAFADSEVPRIAKTKEVGEELVEQVREIKESLLKLSEFPSQEDFWNRHEDLSLRFERLARAWGERIRHDQIRTARLTMEDLELFSLWLARKAPETAAYFSKEWNYWLIDEYQDTSLRQVKLIQALTQGRTAFLVGDPQQSIYLFRGARSEVFSEAEDAVRARGGETLELMTNYRTSAPVLEFMNELFTSASRQLQPMKAGRAEEPIPFAHVTLWQVPKENKSEGLQVEAVVQRVQEMIEAGVSPESICVLSRKRADLASIAQRAGELGVPCQLHAAGRFFERREVQDALAFLKFLVTPEDNENLVALLRSPWLPLTDSQILEICHSEKRSFWSALKQKSSEAAFATTVEILSTALASVQRQGVSRVWRDLLVRQKLFDYAQKLDPSGRREANLWKLVQSLFAQEFRPGFRYADFLEQPELVDTEEVGSGDASPVVEPKRVQLMTVHASKGLQFPHVIVPFMDDDTVKVDRSFFCWNESEKVWGLSLRDPESQKLAVSAAAEREYELRRSRGEQELDRLFYVALTRAQSSLSLIWSPPSEKAEKKIWAKCLISLSMRENPPWKMQFREEKPEARAFAASAPRELQVRDPWTAPVQKQGLRQIVSVTSVLADSTGSGRASSSSGQSWEKIRRSVRGTEVHRLMESLKYDPERRLARPEFKEALAFLESPEGAFIQTVIGTGEVEWGFAVQLKGRLLQGQVDLWGRDEKGTAWVVDYKTGSPERADKALEQLEIYTWALRKVGKISDDEPVQLAAVFPFHGQVVKKQAPSQVEIEKALAEKLGD